jgi:cathepsin L
LRRKAFEIAVSRVTGLRIPRNFTEIAKRQARPAPAPAPEGLQATASVSPKAKALDWRRHNKVTPVRTYLENHGQGDCGCCWCFAAVAAFEGSYLRLRGGDPAELDASEQDILNSGDNGGCDGDWYWTAWETMEKRGTATEKDVPYTGSPDSNASSRVQRPYRVAAYGLVSDSASIPNEDSIKEALCKYGPLAVAVYVNDKFLAYDSGVFQEYPRDDIKPGQVNHAVTLIGWDDDKQAWLIKNSWGTDWGESGGQSSGGGYMWIKYGSNNIGYAAAWARATRD